MIKINLLPVQFRVAKKKKAKAKTLSSGAVNQNLSAKTMPWALVSIALAALFLLVTLYYDFEFIQISKKMKSLSVESAVVQPQLQVLKALEAEVTGLLVPEKDFLMTHVLNKAPLTAVLQKISEVLPDGMWLQSLTVNNSGKSRSFELSGLAISVPGKTNIESIEDFLQKVQTVISNSKFTYSTTKQLFEKAPATAFSAEFKWRAD